MSLAGKKLTKKKHQVVFQIEITVSHNLFDPWNYLSHI